MQTNTTGHSMHDFLDFFLIWTFCISFVSNLFFLIKIRKLSKAANVTINDHMKALITITEQLQEIHRSVLALREPLESTNPMKPNNWDSVREAFKGPIRIEVNERT